MQKPRKMEIKINQASPDDYEKFPEIEMDAGHILSEFGLETVANMPATSVEYYYSLPAGSIVHAAYTENAFPIAFALCIQIDNEAHLKELSVCRAYMQQGIGSRLVNATVNWATKQNFQLLTLTTYRDISFNAPFYQKFGFSVFEPDNKWPMLKQIRAEEKRHGLDIKPRVCMKLNLI